MAYGQAEYLDYEAREGLKILKKKIETQTKFKKSFSDVVKYLLFIEKNCKCIDKTTAKKHYQYL